MTEPDVTLTDYGLTLECVLFTVLLYKGSRLRGAQRRSRAGRYTNACTDRTLRLLWVLFFGSVGLAALTGGSVHGFFLDRTSLGHRILWPATLLAIGATAGTGWALGARLLFTRPRAHQLSYLAGLAYAAYAAYVLAVSQRFVVAVWFYAPAALFLLAALTIAFVRTRARPVLWGAAGLVLTFIASGIQQSGIALHPTYFNHNALYHALEAVALWLLFICARRLVTATAREGAAPC